MICQGNLTDQYQVSTYNLSSHVNKRAATAQRKIGTVKVISHNPTQNLITDQVNPEKLKQPRRLLHLGKRKWITVIVVGEIRSLDTC